MWPVDAPFLAALAQPHGVAVTVEAWRDGARYGAVPIAGGSVQVSSRNRIRRTATVVVEEDYWSQTAEGGLLDPYGNELRIWWSLVYADGSVATVPVFRGRIDAAQRTRRAGSFTVTCSDRFADINDWQFETPRAATAGALVTDQIAALLGEVFPAATVTNTTGSTATIPTGTMWDRDRGQAVDDLAQSIGAEVYADPNGDFHLRAVPTVDNSTPVWSLIDGVNGTVIADELSRSRVGVANVVVVLVERPDGQVPLRVALADDNASSPTAYGGRFGRIPKFVQNSLITSESQGNATATATLSRSIGLTRTRSITCVPNPALEAGDALTVIVDGETETHIADEIGFGLAATDTMTVASRSARDSGSTD